MLLSAARRCALTSFGSLASSAVCRCARTASRPCHCPRLGARFVSGDRDPNGKLTPEDDEATSSTTTARQTDSTADASASCSGESGMTTQSNKSRHYMEINLFGPKDARAPFPGNVGISPVKYDRKRARPLPSIQQFRLIREHSNESSDQRVTTTIERQVLDYETISDRQTRVIEAVAFSRTIESELNVLFEPIRQHLDLRVFECPQLISGDLKQIFQAKGLDQLHLLMITINRLETGVPMPNDLQLKTREFIDQMCETLNNSGFWCDYIAPDESG
jgi:hypothetical protein